jgi:hypothetical protein
MNLAESVLNQGDGCEAQDRFWPGPAIRSNRSRVAVAAQKAVTRDVQIPT